MVGAAFTDINARDVGYFMPATGRQERGAEPVCIAKEYMMNLSKMTFKPDGSFAALK